MLFISTTSTWWSTCAIAWWCLHGGGADVRRFRMPLHRHQPQRCWRPRRSLDPQIPLVHAPLAGDIPSPMDPPSLCVRHRCVHAIDACAHTWPEPREWATDASRPCLRDDIAGLTNP